MGQGHRSCDGTAPSPRASRKRRASAPRTAPTRGQRPCGAPWPSPTARERLRLRHLSLLCQGSLWVQPRGQLPAAAPASGLSLPPAQLGVIHFPPGAHSEVLPPDGPPLLLATGSSRCLPLFLVSSHTSNPDTPFLVGALGTGGRSRTAIPPPHAEVTYTGPNQRARPPNPASTPRPAWSGAFRAAQASQLSPHHSSCNSKTSHLEFRNPGSEGATHLPQAGPWWVIISFDPHRQPLGWGLLLSPLYRQGNGVTENLLGDLCEVAGLARVEPGI